MEKLNIKRSDFIEKIIFTGLLVFIFTNIFSSLQSTFLRVFVGVSVIILINAFISHILINSSKFKVEIYNSFLAMFVINSVTLFLYISFVTKVGSINFVLIAFFAYIITLITVLYDRFKPYFIARFGKAI